MNKSDHHTAPAPNLDMLGRSGAAPLAEVFEVLKRLMAAHPGPAVEEIEADEALGRISAQPLYAPEELPVHPRSVMDGYAVRAADTYGASANLPAYLTISGEVKMGEMPTAGPAPTECYRIATGGLLPPGCDAVVMLEHTVPAGDNLLEVVKPVAPGGNIIARGDDVQTGEELLPAGHRFRPCDLGLLAGLGLGRLQVFARPRVGIISTGDEIVPPEQTPPPGKIRDMNMAGLLAMVQSQGAVGINYGIVGDREDDFVAQMQQALAECDLIMFSGGTSVGVGDLGERVLGKLTSPGILIHGVAVKPGKPVIIAAHGPKPVFGLPGHPVSAAASFALLVRPLLAGLGGRRHSITPTETAADPIRIPSPVATATLQRNLNSAAGRTDLVPVKLQTSPTGDLVATPVLGKSSALSTLVRAHGWIIIDAHRQGLDSGSQVAVYNFDTPDLW
ncbi:molybdopterin molybdotransferase MoeA [Desulfurivibrio alkaliphilus]|uniref:Molybdopterin molybdenumtransferase n=1 Tax=Desulfurivibrio alkaliphilus (strain DSM 19089 / UNIQEM U267 / AHT2) TaxID=589865 RepID=D6Z3F9_DESAT|nr:gephyrin-like molybdotransferase Glp [Desulfurivibrio alkaliphilus]ADH86084.1 molybdenum cofactor synthesis domain protein [Desulfurivibrio alkaliphilus AHT 2]